MDAIKEGLRSAFVSFMGTMLNKLIAKIESNYMIANFLYYSDALVAGQYTDDYLNKYVQLQSDRQIIKRFIPQLSCGRNTADLRPVFEAKAQFLEYVEIEKGLSLKTVRNYDHYLSRFFEFAKVKDAEDIDESKLREFRLFLNRQEGQKVRGQSAASMKKNTQNYHLIALRSFLKYLMKRGVEVMSPEKIELAKAAQDDNETFDGKTSE
jgi:hypothetical protein